MPTEPVAKPLRAGRAGPLKGTVRPPGDKSISHRALMLGALAVGETTVDGLLEGEDVLSTAEAMRAFGATVSRTAPGAWKVKGLGVGGLLEPDGRHRLRQRRHRRAPRHGHRRHPRLRHHLHRRRLARRPADGPRLRSAPPHGRPGRGPLGRPSAGDRPRPGRCRCRSNIALPVASAQVKSAVLLAGLNVRRRHHGDRADRRPATTPSGCSPPSARRSRSRAPTTAPGSSASRAVATSSPRPSSCRAIRARPPSRSSPR